MKNEKLLLKRPWPSEIPEFTTENALEHNDYPWTSGGPKVPTCFYANSFPINEKAYLEIVFYIGKQMKYRMFFTDREYIGQNAANLKASEAGIEYLEQYQILEHWYRGSKESAEVICQHFKWKSRNDPIHKIREWIKQDKARRLKEHHDRIRKSVDDVMLQIKPIPKDFERWVQNVPLKMSKYIFYKYSDRKMVRGVCSECHQEVSVIRPRNNQPGVCPNCKAKITYKSAGNAGHIVDQAYVSLVQKTKNGYVIRYFYAKKYYFACCETLSVQWNDINGSYRNPRFELYERAREFEEDYRNYYIWEDFKNTGEYRFCQENCASSGRSYLYGRNCKVVFSDEHSNRKYFPYADFCNHAPAIDAANFLKGIIRIPQIEYLAKAKLYRLTADIMDGFSGDDVKNILKAKRLWEGLGVPKDCIPILQKEDMDLAQIRLFMKAIRYGKDQAIIANEWANKNRSQYWVIDNLIECIEYTTPVKALKYLESQRHLIGTFKGHYNYTFRYIYISDIQREWVDYLKNASKLGYDLKNNFVLFPKHLPEAHDEMTNQKMAMEEKIKESKYAAIEKIASDLNKVYGLKSNTFFIRAPRDYKELTKEGQDLHHCVGTYAMRHAMQETTILFIRTIEDPETPFYTLEYQREKIVQVRGKGNCSMTPEVQAFVNAWEKKINQKKQKLQLATVAG